MSKYLIIGDEHWGISNMNPTMIEQNISLWKYIGTIITSYNIDGIIDLGDFFDKRKEIDSSLLDIVKKEVIDRIEFYKVPLYLIVGNHNLYYKESSKVNNLEPLGDYSDYVHIIRQPKRIGNIDLFPWINNENIEEVNQYIKDSSAKYCCGHFEFSGFNFDKFNIANCHEKISQKTFKDKYNKVFSGHYHISSQQDNIYYIGTPVQLTWIDVNVEKSFLIFDDETGLIDTVFATPFELFAKFNLDDNTYADILNSDLTNKRVRITYEEDWEDSNKKKFEELKKYLNDKKPDIIQYIKNPKPKSTNKIIIDEREDLKSSIKQYIEENEYSNKDLLKKLIDKLY